MSVRWRYLALLIPLAFGACGGNKTSASSSGAGSASVVKVTISDAGCDPAAITTAPGKTKFAVRNSGSSKVTEFYVYEGEKVIGEVENVLAGSDKTLMLRLHAGSFTTKCPNGDKVETGTLTVVA